MDADSSPQPLRKPRSFRWFVIALILINLTVVAYLFAPQAAGDQIRRQLLGKLQAHYPHLDVRISSGRVGKEGLVVLQGIEFWTRDQGPSAPPRPILRIASLDVHTNLHLERLLDGTMPVCPTRIVAQDVVVDVWRKASGRWSPELLWPPLVMEGGCPFIEVRNGRLRLHSDTGQSVRPLELDQIYAAVGLTRATQADPAAKPSINASFEISAGSAFVDSIRLNGKLEDGQISVAGEAQTLRIDRSLLTKLPMLSAEVIDNVRGANVTTDVRWTASGQVDWNASAPTFEIDWSIRDGRFEHATLPQPLEQLTGKIAMQREGIEVLWAQARFGDADLRISGNVFGWDNQAAFSGRLNAAGLLVNERLARKLPDGIGQAWDEIRPEGPIDLDLQFSRQIDKWQSSGTAELRGVDVQISNFPYPVSQLIGPLRFDNERVATDGLSGRIGGQRLSVAFDQMRGGRPGATWLQMAADGPVAIDSPLLAALTPMGQPTSDLENFVRTLTPSGSVHLVAARFDRNEQGEPRKSLDLRVTGGSLRYKEFPYPLYDVRGQITVHDDWVRLVGFQASNTDNAKILCDGNFLSMPDGQPHPTDGDWQLALHFRTRDLPLDETLRAALTPDSRDLWDQLSPTGVIAQADVSLHHADRWSEPKMVISANQFSRPTIDNRTVSLRATSIPYRIDIVEGAVQFDGNEVKIHSLDGRHDSTRIAADGRCIQTESGQWRMDLNIHSGSRLHPDPELIGSLPREVRGTFQKLQLRGPLSARGTLGVLLPDTRHPDPTVDWNINFQLEGNRIGDVGPVRDLRGEITMRGLRDANSVVADGMIQIDSMHIENQQITSITGPYGIRDDRLYLGEAMAQLTDNPESANRLESLKPTPIQAKVFDGLASLSGDVLLSDGAFNVVVSIADADVAKMLVDIGQADSNFKGVAQGQVRLEGVVGASHLLKGAGSASLSQANLYQLPLLISVFNMLRVKPSESVAFTDGTARFSIYGDNVSFSELKLWGDLIQLDGTGTMNRSHEVDLSFNTRVSPQNIWSVVTDSFGENNYTLMVLYVRGPLANAQVERRAMDAVGGTLERLMPGISDLSEPAPVRSRLSRIRERFTR